MYSKRINPSTDDFLKAIEIVDAKNVFILPNDSNLFLVAEQARKLEKNQKFLYYLLKILLKVCALL